MNIIRTAMLAAATLFVATPILGAQGTNVTSNSLFANAKTIDLSGQANGQYNFTNGPVALPGNITFTASPAGGSVLGQGCYGLGSNGTLGCYYDKTYAGLNAAAGTMRFTFVNAVSGVGAFVNYDPSFGSVFMRLLGETGNVLDEFNIFTAAPINGDFADEDQGAFRGIVRQTNDVYAVEFEGGFVAASDLNYLVPEPSTNVLIATGLALAAAARRRKIAA